MSGDADLVALARDASTCTYCFDNFDLKHAIIDLPQPRWVGPKYWSSTRKTLVVLLNPGSGSARLDDANHVMAEKLHAFGNRRVDNLDPVFDHQRKDMVNWGRGRFWKYYIEGLGMNVEEVALANIAWCATEGNKYPSKMLSACFARHTGALLKILTPDIVLLSGSGVHPYRKAMEEILPRTAIIEMMHYAHREGASAEDNELQRVRKEMANI